MAKWGKYLFIKIKYQDFIKKLSASPHILNSLISNNTNFLGKGGGRNWQATPL